MIKYNFPAFASTIYDYDNVAVLIIYDITDKILKDKDFLQYVENIMTNQDISNSLAKCIVYTDKKDFLINEDAIELEHELVNQVIFFKNRELNQIMLLEDIKSEYIKIKK